jgi:endonuclease/exonuclease/phosphatase family metal-dependent hydrolase
MAVPDGEPIVFCGDLNAGPWSPVYRGLSRYLTDAQMNSLNSKRFHPTFPSRRPLFRIDHIFTSAHFRTLKTLVLNNEKSRLASDHLPLCADLEIQAG